MITPTGNHRNPYSFSRQHKASQSGFADLFAKSAAARANGTQVQQSVATTAQKEDKIEFGSVTGLEVNGATISSWKQWKAAEPSFPKSIYDLSPDELEKALTAAKDAASHIGKARETEAGVYEDKTRAEIYNEIQIIYENYLGKDFMEPAQLFNFRNDTEADQMNRVAMRFHDSVKFNGIDMENSYIRKEVKGYGDMSDDEIREAIRDKYPEDMTLRECLLMSRELDSLNLQESPGNQDYFSAFTSRIMFTLGGWNQGTRKVYDAMLNLPADYDAMKVSYADHVNNNYNTSPMNNIDGVIKRLASITGGDASAYGGIHDMLTAMEKNGELYFSNGFLWASGYGPASV